MTDEVKNEVEETEEVVAETEEQPQPSYIEQIAAKMSREVQYNNFYKKDEVTEDAMPALPADTDNAATQNAHKKNAPGEKKLSDAGLEVPGEEKGGAGGSTARKADKSGGDTTTKAAVQQDPDNKKNYDAMGVKLGEAKDIDADNTEKALKHDCATHVVHKEHGEGRCIPGMHTLEENEDGTGYVTHYDVMFNGEEGPFIVENCPVEDLEVIKEKHHGHMRKKKSMKEGIHDTHHYDPKHYHPKDKHYGSGPDLDPKAHDLIHGKNGPIHHMQKKGYKVNHVSPAGRHTDMDGEPTKAHKNPDITVHHDHEHGAHGYTVHHKGAAANDSRLHHASLHNRLNEAHEPGHPDKQKDKTYSDNYDNPRDDWHSHFKKVQSHVKKHGLKVNHDDNGHPHKKPDITYHTAMGDDDPHAYTVHHKGKAMGHKELHSKVKAHKVPNFM